MGFPECPGGVVMELDNLNEAKCEICGEYFEEPSQVEDREICDECVEKGLKEGRFVVNPDML